MNAIQDPINIGWQAFREGHVDLEADSIALMYDKCFQRGVDIANGARVECKYQGLVDDTLHSEIITACDAVYEDRYAAETQSCNFDHLRTN